MFASVRLLRGYTPLNQLFHRKTLSPLPYSLPSSSIDESFCSFFPGEINTLDISLSLSLSLSRQTLISKPQSTSAYPLPITKRQHTILVPIITNTINLSLSAGSFPLRQCCPTFVTPRTAQDIIMLAPQ